jgi:hypothetical protein
MMVFLGDFLDQGVGLPDPFGGRCLAVGRLRDIIFRPRTSPLTARLKGSGGGLENRWRWESSQNFAFGNDTSIYQGGSKVFHI